MKTTIKLIFLFLFISNPALANNAQVRYESTEKIYINLEGAYDGTIGQKSTISESYRWIMPYALSTVSPDLQVGMSLLIDSEETEQLGPAIRYKNKIGPMSSIIEPIFLVGKESSFYYDFFWKISFQKNKWSYGFTLYPIGDQTNFNLKIRPFEISYDFDNISPFLMLQDHWKNGE